jgi:hypothetical protein
MSCQSPWIQSRQHFEGEVPSNFVQACAPAVGGGRDVTRDKSLNHGAPTVSNWHSFDTSFIGSSTPLLLTPYCRATLLKIPSIPITSRPVTSGIF